MPPFSSRSILACILPTVIAVLSVYWFRKKRKLKINTENCMTVEKPSIESSETDCQDCGSSESSQIECQSVGLSGLNHIECQSLGTSGTPLLPELSENITSGEKSIAHLDFDIEEDVTTSKNDSNVTPEDSQLSISLTVDCPVPTEETHRGQNFTEGFVESKCNGFLISQKGDHSDTSGLCSDIHESTKLQNELNRTHKEVAEQFKDNFLETALNVIYDSNAEVIPKENVCKLQSAAPQSEFISCMQQQDLDNVQSKTDELATLPVGNQNDECSSIIDSSDPVDSKALHSTECAQSTNSPLSNPSDCDVLSSVGTSSISLNELTSNSPLNSPHEHLSMLNDSAIGDEEELFIDSGNCSIRGSICRSSASHDLDSHPDEKVPPDAALPSLDAALPSLDAALPSLDAALPSPDANAVTDQNTEPVQNNHDAIEPSRCSDGLNCEPVHNPPQQVADAECEVSAVNGKRSIDPLAKVFESANRYVYEFELPYELCGRFIGRQGKYVKYIKEYTNAIACIKRHPYNDALKLVTVEGTRSDVHFALDQIRKRFPLSMFPSVTLAQTNVPVDALNVPEPLQLHLPEGVSVDVILSSMVTAGHFFLQQPTHPTYPSLSTLDQCMMTCYTQAETPALPSHIDAGIICAATIMGGWYRAQIMYVFENGDQCEIKYVDYGGYSHVSSSSLRQIRSDFMTLPFQASECYLANVQPLNIEMGWTQEAAAVFEELAQGQILQAMVVNVHEDGTPQVHLYRVQGISSTFINRELVNRGMAKWVENR